MTEVQADPGVCGLKTNIKVDSKDMTAATVTVESECPDIQKLAEELGELPEPLLQFFEIEVGILFPSFPG